MKPQGRQRTAVKPPTEACTIFFCAKLGRPMGPTVGAVVPGHSHGAIEPCGMAKLRDSGAGGAKVTGRPMCKGSCRDKQKVQGRGQIRGICPWGRQGL